ncbi:Uncharacterised protein [uncultured archaeon]|nr:Uncharacterised protein [uncultured archaeon]
MGKDKRDKMIFILVAVVVLLLGFIGYLFLIRPALSGLVVQGQNQGVQYTVLSIAQQAATCKTVSLPVGNQTMDLVWVKCLQQPSQTTQQATPDTTTAAK